MNDHLQNSFDHDAEMWHVYDYARCAAAGRDVYFAATWEDRGGVNDSGYIWADDSRWSVDTPENPHSILALMTWRQWHLRGPVDLRDTPLSLYLRGENLDLKGGYCTFWVLCRRLSTRWHFAAQPLPIEPIGWAKTPTVVTLDDDESQWHRSWTVPGNAPASLHEVLGEVDSYGLAFVGFSQAVTGRLAMDEFQLTPVK